MNAIRSWQSWRDGLNNKVTPHDIASAKIQLNMCGITEGNKKIKKNNIEKMFVFFSKRLVYTHFTNFYVKLREYIM